MRHSWVYPIVLILAMALTVGAGMVFTHITRYDDMISQAAARHSLDFYLVKALIYEETWFRPDVRGSAGELGLMQITKAAAADFTARRGLAPIYEPRLLEPELNLEIGCWYLHQSLERYKDSPDPIVFALLRYNAGATRADGWLKAMQSRPIPPGLSPEQFCLSLVDINSTREYVRHVLNRYRSRNFWF